MAKFEKFFRAWKKHKYHEMTSDIWITKMSRRMDVTKRDVIPHALSICGVFIFWRPKLIKSYFKILTHTV